VQRRDDKRTFFVESGLDMLVQLMDWKLQLLFSDAAGEQCSASLLICDLMRPVSKGLQLQDDDYDSDLFEGISVNMAQTLALIEDKFVMTMMQNFPGHLLVHRSAIQLAEILYVIYHDALPVRMDVMMLVLNAMHHFKPNHEIQEKGLLVLRYAVMCLEDVDVLNSMADVWTKKIVYAILQASENHDDLKEISFLTLYVVAFKSPLAKEQFDQCIECPFFFKHHVGYQWSDFPQDQDF